LFLYLITIDIQNFGAELEKYQEINRLQGLEALKKRNDMLELKKELEQLSIVKPDPAVH